MKYFNKMILAAICIVLPFSAFALSGTYCTGLIHLDIILKLKPDGVVSYENENSWPVKTRGSLTQCTWDASNTNVIHGTWQQSGNTVVINVPGQYSNISCTLEDNAIILDCGENGTFYTQW